MNVENALLTAGALVAMGAAIRWMILANRKDQRHIARRRQEWIDAGRVPEDEPKFWDGGLGGGGGGS